MTVKKAIHQIHLWLGLASGLVVFIVGITGCLYVFIDELEPVISPYQIVKTQQQPVLPPSQLGAIAQKSLNGKTANYVNYRPGKAAYVGLYGTDYSLAVYINQYTGKPLHTTDFLYGFDFFSFVLHGHRALWLPYNIGQPIVDYGVLMFVVLLITGMVLWWPKNLKKSNRDKSFKIKWGAKFKRVNYDLHNVLGFYAMVVLLVISLTGLVWGFQWVEKSIYWATSGGKTLPEFKESLSDTSNIRGSKMQNIDKLWYKLYKQNLNAEVAIFYPQQKSSPIQANINYNDGKNYDIDIYYFDQYTLKPLPAPGVYTKHFKDASIADKINRLDYDLHTGMVLGLPTKILAFFASLICASLPVTGFYIWWGKRKKKRKKWVDPKINHTVLRTV